MKIAMFTDAFFPRINGVYISVNSFATQLVNLGHEVCIICPSYEKVKKSYEEKIELENGKHILVYRLSSHEFVFSKEDRLAKLTQYPYMKKYLDAFKPDIVHINSEFPVGRLGHLYSKKRKIPMVYTFHTYWETYFKNYATFIPEKITRAIGRSVTIFFLKRANYIICPTHRFEQVVKEYGISRECIILPTGISLKKVSKEDEKAKEVEQKIKNDFPICKDKRILLYVGRVAVEKNLDFLVNVFDEVCKTNDDVCMIFTGGGPSLESLKKTAFKSKNKNLIHFTDYVPRDELPYIYQMADIFVFPSLTETQGLVTIEAMTQSLPVVAIGEMGTLDVMQGDNGGFMVQNNLNEFVQKVNLLLSDKNLLEEKRKEAQKYSEQWSIEQTTNKLLSLYNSI